MLVQVGLFTMGLVDTAMVGRVAPTELAALALGNSLFFVVSVFGIGICFSIEPVAAQFLGQRELRKSFAAYKKGQILALLMVIPLSVIIWAIGYCLPFFDFDETLVLRTQEFFIGRIPGLGFLLLFASAKSYVQAMNQPRIAVWATMIGNLVNLIADYLLIFGDAGLSKIGLPAVGLVAMGSTGAAIGTSIADLFQWGIATFLAHPFSKKMLRTSPSPKKNSPNDDEAISLTSLFLLGLPIGLQLLAEVGIFTFVTFMMGRFSVEMLAGHHVALSIVSVAFCMVWGMAQSTGIVVAQEIGSGSKKGPLRAGVFGLGTGAIMMTHIALIFFFFRRNLAQ